LDVTFSQDTGYNNSQVIRINAYHPIIISAMRFFESQESKTDNTFQFALDKKVLNNAIHDGEYFLAVYTSTTIKKWFNREQKSELLVPILYDVHNGKIINDKNLSERFFGESQLHATAKSNAYMIPEDLISDMEYIFAEEIEVFESENLKEHRMRLETHKKMQIQRKTEFFDNRINRQKTIIENSENRLKYTYDEKERKNIDSILPAQRKVLLNFEEEKENALQEINAGEILYKSPQLLSLNHVTIY
jgi:hypothetical protein